MESQIESKPAQPALDATLPPIERSNKFLIPVSSDTSSPDSGRAQFHLKKTKKEKNPSVCSVFWQLEVTEDSSTFVLRTLAPQFLSPVAYQGESFEALQVRKHKEAAQHDNTHGYWLLEFVKEQLRNPQSHINNVLKNNSNTNVGIDISIIGYAEGRIQFKLNSFEKNELIDFIEAVQKQCAQFASPGAKYWPASIFLEQLSFEIPVVTQIEGYDIVHTTDEPIPFGKGILHEPLTKAIIGEASPLFTIMKNGKGRDFISVHYGGRLNPPGMSIEQLHTLLIEQFGFVVKEQEPEKEPDIQPTEAVVETAKEPVKAAMPSKPTVTSTEAKKDVPPLLPPKKDIDYIQVAIDSDIEDASYLIQSSEQLPKNIDGKFLKWSDKTLERKEIIHPETNKSLGFVYRSVVLDGDTLTFRFFRTRREAVEKRITNVQMKDLVERFNVEGQKPENQKKLEKLGKDKNLAEIKEGFAMEILDIEASKKSSEVASIQELTEFALAWLGIQDETETSLFTSQLRELIFNGDELAKLVKFARDFEKSFSRQRDLVMNGDHSVIRSLLLIEVLGAAIKLSEGEQLEKLTSAHGKLNQAFKSQFEKGAPWAKAQVPVLQQLTKLRVAYALPELPITP